MGYYIRVLGRNADDISLQALREAATPALIQVQRGMGDSWEQLVLQHQRGSEIALIEKNLVVPGELGADELQEFIGEAPLLKPVSGANWLTEYLPKVRVIYAFQLLSGAMNDGWGIVHKVYSRVWESTSGILQADGEGFTNEEGFTIVWQFSETVTGLWRMGVLTDAGHWTHFEIELGNMEHRDAFWTGKVPVGAKLL